MTPAASPSSPELLEALSYWSPAETRVAEEELPLLEQGRGDVVPAQRRKWHRNHFTQVSLWSSKEGKESRRSEGVVVKGQVPFRIRSGDSQRSNPITAGGVLYCIC